MAALLDFRGSVHLAHCLQGAVAIEPSPFGRRVRGAPLLLGDYVRRQLAVIERSVPRGALRPPSAADVHARVDSAIAIARLYRDHAAATFARGRSDVDALRDEVADDLRALGGETARLEAIDAALRGAMREKIGGLLERLAEALATSLAARLAPAIAELPSSPGVADVEPWLAPGGVLGAHVTRVQEMGRIFVRRDAGRLLALVDAACKEAS